MVATADGVFLTGRERDLLIAAGLADRPAVRLSSAEGTTPLAISGDQRWLARAYRYRDIELLDAASGRPLAPPLYWNPGGIQLLSQIAFTDDDSALVARTSQGRRLLWPLSFERRDVAALRRHLQPLLSAGEVEGAPLPGEAEQRSALGAADPGKWTRLSAPPPRPALRHIDGEPLPPRTAAATPWMLDLSAAYTLAPTGNWGPRDHVIASLYPLPWGVQRLAGVDYDIRGALGLNSPSGPGGDAGGPSRVSGIAVPDRPITAFHVLLLAGNRNVEPEPREYARLRLRYADGSEATLPMLTGRDVPGYAGGDSVVPVAWDYGLHLRLLGEPVFLPINNPRLVNPHPERVVRSLDIESGSGTWNAPVVFAISAEPVIDGP